MPTLSVVIPTYQRPIWLARAVRSLAEQSPVPTEVIAVARDDDLPTHQAIAELQRTALPFPLHIAVITEPGFMPPVREGIALARGEVVAVMDDDAEAIEGWTRNLLRHYSDEQVGGAGGRYINMDGERLANVPSADRVGYVGITGQFVGNMYKRLTFDNPVDVAFLMGGCMSYRRAVARSLEFDMSLNQSVAFGYEVDLGLQVRRAGFRLVFDPAVAIRHYSAPRAEKGMRSLGDERATFWYAHNQTRIAMRRLPLLRRIVALVWLLMVGERNAPGLLPWALAPLTRRAGFQTRVSQAALSGRLRAIRGVFRPSAR